MPYAIAHTADHLRLGAVYWHDKVSAHLCELIFGVYPTERSDAAQRHGERFHRGAYRNFRYDCVPQKL